jgi:hypothetical protein
MSITSAILRQIIAMPEQAKDVALTFLAAQLEADEAIELRRAEIRRKDAERKRNKHGIPAEIQTNSSGNPPSRVEDKSSLTSLSQKEDKNLSPSLSKPLPAKTEPDDFAAFMAVYPRRNGAVDRKAALKAFGPALKRADFQTILHGAKRYNADMTATGKIGTEFVKQARTWLNADGWQEYAHTATASGNTVSQVPVFVETPAWKDWTRHLGKAPPTTDIRIPGKQIQRGWYFPTEYPPPQEQAA